MKASKIHLEQLHCMLGQDELFEQDKDLLWMLRYEVRDRFPEHLNQLLQAIKWNNHIDVAKVSVCSSLFDIQGIIKWMKPQQRPLPVPPEPK